MQCFNGLDAYKLNRSLMWSISNTETIY